MKRQLTFGANCYAPVWSPDGEWIAYDTGGGDNADIWRISVRGGDPQPLIRNPGADWMPSWSPDGKRIAFLSNRSGSMQVWIFDMQSDTVHQVTDMERPAGTPRWHPDGNNIAFTIDRGLWTSLYMIGSDAKEPTLLSSLKIRNDLFSYCFDPSGDRIYIYDYEIYEFKLPAGPVRQLSNLRSKGIVLNPDLSVGAVGDKFMIGSILKQGGDIWVIEDE